MPIVNAQGMSECTIDKQEGFERYLALHMSIVKNVWNRRRPSGWRPDYREYVYIDTHAGSGSNGPYGDGSPVIFARVADRLSIPYYAFFIEREQINAELLTKIFETNKRTFVLNEDNWNVIDAILDKIPLKAYGLLYMDPNGLPDLEILGKAANKLQKMDIMVRYPATVQKRCRHQGKGFMTDIIETVAKEKWLIREPMPWDRFQWTFLFGTNFSEMREWKTRRFYSIEKPEGQDILRRMNYTDAEIKEMSSENIFVIHEVIARSNNICEVCRLSPAVVLHHLKYGPKLTPSDYLHLCDSCHCAYDEVYHENID